MPFTSMLWTIGKNKSQNTLTNTKKKNQEVSSNIIRTNDSKIGISIKNLSTIANLAKSKKSDLIKSKKLKLT